MRLLALLTAGLFTGSLIAAPVPKEKLKDEEAILGTWKAVSADDGTGKEPPADRVANVMMKFDKGGKLTSRFTSAPEAESTFKLDPSAKPKTIDMIEGKIVTPAIYELDGDTLKLCFTPGTTRPTEFKADPKAFIVIITFKREKDEKKEEKREEKK